MSRGVRQLRLSGLALKSQYSHGLDTCRGRIVDLMDAEDGVSRQDEKRKT